MAERKFNLAEFESFLKVLLPQVGVHEDIEYIRLSKLDGIFVMRRLQSNLKLKR